MSRHLELSANESFRALFEPGGQAHEVIQDARRKLESANYPADPHEIGFERGRIAAMRQLVDRVSALAQKEQTDTERSERDPEPSKRQPPRRIAI